jgi:hypothetical protein
LSTSHRAPQVPAGLLVGQEGKYHVPRRTTALPHPPPHDREDHRVHILHVHRAPAPDRPVHGLAGKRRDGPVRGVGRDDVQVAVHEEGRPGRILSPDPGHHARPAWVRFQDCRLQADLAEEGGNVLGREPLTGPGVIPVVACVDPDQVAAQDGDLVFCGRGGARCMLGHPPIVAPAARSGPASLPAVAGGGLARRLVAINCWLTRLRLS